MPAIFVEIQAIHQKIFSCTITTYFTLSDKLRVRYLPTGVPHSRRACMRDPIVIFRSCTLVITNKCPNLQGLTHEINDFPARSEVRIVEGAKNGHDNVLILRVLVVGKDGEYRDAVVPFIFSTL